MADDSLVLHAHVHHGAGAADTAFLQSGGKFDCKKCLGGLPFYRDESVTDCVKLAKGNTCTDQYPEYPEKLATKLNPWWCRGKWGQGLRDAIEHGVPAMANAILEKAGPTYKLTTTTIKFIIQLVGTAGTGTYSQKVADFLSSLSQQTNQKIVDQLYTKFKKSKEVLNKFYLCVFNSGHREDSDKSNVFKMIVKYNKDFEEFVDEVKNGKKQKKVVNKSIGQKQNKFS